LKRETVRPFGSLQGVNIDEVQQELLGRWWFTLLGGVFTPLLMTSDLLFAQCRGEKCCASALFRYEQDDNTG